MTGGNAGIGKCIVQLFAERGAYVILACRSTEKGRQAVQVSRNAPLAVLLVFWVNCGLRLSAASSRGKTSVGSANSRA